MTTQPHSRVNRYFGIAVSVTGILIIAVFVGADLLGSGSTAKFGYLQMGGAAAGLLGLIAGLTISFLLRKPVPAWMVNVFISTVVLVIMLIGTEFGLRWLSPTPPRADSASRTIADRVLGYRLAANTVSNSANAQAEVTVRTNSQGLRDVEHTLIPEEGVFRIVVLGDSFMEGYFVELDDTFSRRLEARFHAEGYTQVEVINLGVGGYNTLQEYLIFEEVGRQYQPDLVLLAVFLENDVVDNLYFEPAMPHGYVTLPEGRFYDRPKLAPGSMGDWEIVPGDYGHNLNIQQAAMQDQGENAAVQSWQDWELYRMFDQVVARSRFERSMKAGAATVKDDDPIYWLATFLCDAPPEIEEAWLTTERIVAHLAQSVDETGAEFVVFSVPSLAETDTIFRAVNLRKTADPDDFCFEPSIGSQRLGDLLARQGIDYIDPLPAFRDFTTKQGRTLFYTIEDRHWAPDGHALAANVVYEALVARNLIPAP